MQGVPTATRRLRGCCPRRGLLGVTVTLGAGTWRPHGACLPSPAGPLPHGTGCAALATLEVPPSSPSSGLSAHPCPGTAGGGAPLGVGPPPPCTRLPRVGSTIGCGLSTMTGAGPGALSKFGPGRPRRGAATSGGSHVGGPPRRGVALAQTRPRPGLRLTWGHVFFLFCTPPPPAPSPKALRPGHLGPGHVGVPWAREQAPWLDPAPQIFPRVSPGGVPVSPAPSLDPCGCFLNVHFREDGRGRETS